MLHLDSHYRHYQDAGCVSEIDKHGSHPRNVIFLCFTSCVFFFKLFVSPSSVCVSYSACTYSSASVIKDALDRVHGSLADLAVTAFLLNLEPAIADLVVEPATEQVPLSYDNAVSLRTSKRSSQLGQSPKIGPAYCFVRQHIDWASILFDKIILFKMDSI